MAIFNRELLNYRRVQLNLFQALTNFATAERKVKYKPTTFTNIWSRVVYWNDFTTRDPVKTQNPR